MLAENDFGINFSAKFNISCASTHHYSRILVLNFMIDHIINHFQYDPTPTNSSIMIVTAGL
jgi:hypothetical protein